MRARRVRGRHKPRRPPSRDARPGTAPDRQRRPTAPAPTAPAPRASRPYPQYGYGHDPAHGAAIAAKTNGLAIASLICSCAGLFFVPAIPGIVLGFVARAQIKRSDGAQRGDGLALAGIIVGFGWLVLLALGIALGARNTSSSGIVASMFSFLFAVPCCGVVGPVN